MLEAAPRPPYEASLPHASVLAVCFSGYEELVAEGEPDGTLVTLMHLLHLRCARRLAHTAAFATDVFADTSAVSLMPCDLLEAL